MSDATTEALLASPPGAFSAKRGRGRRPIAQSNSRECRDKIATWKLTPEDKRKPPTLTALAAELGVSKQMASYYAQQVPESIEQFVDNAEREALGRYPGILRTLSDLAEKGSVEAIKVYIRELAGPRRPQKPQSAIMDLHLQQAIRVLVSPSASCAVNASERQIRSNSHGDGESTS